jgi:hypothetical protein
MTLVGFAEGRRNGVVDVGSDAAVSMLLFGPRPAAIMTGAAENNEMHNTQEYSS